MQQTADSSQLEIVSLPCSHVCHKEFFQIIPGVLSKKNYLSVSLVRRERLAALGMKQQRDDLLKSCVSHTHIYITNCLNDLPISVSCTMIARREQLVALTMKHSSDKTTAHNLTYSHMHCKKKKITWSTI
jgi:hypothetical protein